MNEDAEPFYDRLSPMERSKDPAERIVYRLWMDVTDRRGWRQEADMMDDEIKIEILEAWLKIVRPGIKRAKQ